MWSSWRTRQFCHIWSKIQCIEHTAMSHTHPHKPSLHIHTSVSLDAWTKITFWSGKYRANTHTLPTTYIVMIQTCNAGERVCVCVMWHWAEMKKRSLTCSDTGRKTSIVHVCMCACVCFLSPARKNKINPYTEPYITTTQTHSHTHHTQTDTELLDDWVSVGGDTGGWDTQSHGWGGGDNETSCLGIMCFSQSSCGGRVDLFPAVLREFSRRFTCWFFL